MRRGLYDELPKKTRRVIESCFQAEPQQRPTAEEVLFALAAPDESDPAWSHVKSGCLRPVSSLFLCVLKDFETELGAREYLELGSLKSGSTAGL